MKNAKTAKTPKAAKTVKVETNVVEFRIWCERCSIRVAPNEERTVVAGKTYHPTCYLKLNASPEDLSRAGLHL